MERNKDIARRFYEEVLNERNLDLIEDLVRHDYVEHDPLPGQGSGIEGVKERSAMILDADDPHFTIEDMIAEGDRVAVRWTNSGTNVGELLGMPATGRPFRMQGVDIYRMLDGKLAEHWHVIDMLARLQQLGLLPDPQGA